jgi:hypothetical protein
LFITSRGGDGHSSASPLFRINLEADLLKIHLQTFSASNNREDGVRKPLFYWSLAPNARYVGALSSADLVPHASPLVLHLSENPTRTTLNKKPLILPNYTKIARKYKTGSLIIIYMFLFLICKGKSCDIGCGCKLLRADCGCVERWAVCDCVLVR